MAEYKFQPIEITIGDKDYIFDFGKDLDKDRQRTFHAELTTINTLAMHEVLGGGIDGVDKIIDFFKDYTTNCGFGNQNQKDEG